MESVGGDESIVVSTPAVVAIESELVSLVSIEVRSFVVAGLDETIVSLLVSVVLSSELVLVLMIMNTDDCSVVVPVELPISVD